MICISHSPADLKTIFQHRNLICISHFIPQLSAEKQCLLKCKSELGICTKLPNTVSQPTGNINSVFQVAKRALMSDFNGFAKCLNHNKSQAMHEKSCHQSKLTLFLMKCLFIHQKVMLSTFHRAQL